MAATNESRYIPQKHFIQYRHRYGRLEIVMVVWVETNVFSG